MLVSKMKEILKNKNDNTNIVWAYTGEDISFEEIGFFDEEKSEQGDLFDL